MTALALDEPAARPRGGVRTVYLWELEKLTAQWRVRAVAAICLLAPFAFVLALKTQDTVPSDTLFGRWVHDTGYAVPLVVLGFAGQWGFPLLTSVVAGDIFASEDHHGTWQTILTRSRTRAQIFTGKVLAAATFCVVVVVLAGAGSIAAGVLLVGHQPLVALDGSLVPSGRAAELALLSWLCVLPPALGFTALGVLFSIATRHSAAGITGPVLVGLLMQLYAYVDALDVVRHALLTTPFDAWHGLLSATPYYRPLVEGCAVSAAYTVVCLAAGYLLLRRRDFTKG
ncbi:ABC transporter permease [Streptomyces silvisoli]|uniref:ABC transporter permease n=1 Tax=Streptomyces silvisoli TaxID=3034235 RepID=A0ABT5ZVA6_9ACTN|nr:ABC transporter permease [Streptomyces silvisoli]MDF3293545.1 ABC transporter permease [Streptomyces silvisoli]